MLVRRLILFWLGRRLLRLVGWAWRRRQARRAALSRRGV
jgi:hypothetical protein